MIESNLLQFPVVFRSSLVLSLILFNLIKRFAPIREESRMRTFKIVMKHLFAAFFIFAGLNHFRDPEFYLRIMPPYLPWPSALHLIAGFLEFVFGVMLLIPRTQRLAAWGLIALLLAVYPANIHMAANWRDYPELPMTFHWIRLPLQVVLIAWAWWLTKADEEERVNYEPRKNS